jgi:nucleoside-diphosphate-sugar epimerase
MKKNAVVTGASGFVGSELVKKLLNLKYNVIGLDIAPPIDNLDYEFRQINLGKEDLKGMIPDNSIVFHLGALSTDSACRENPSLALSSNIMGTMQVIETVNNLSNSSLIFASSEWVYPEKSNADFDYEDQTLSLQNLNSLYAITKLMGEDLIRTTCKTTFGIYRFGIVYGPRFTPGSALESICKKVLDGEKIEVGSGMTSRRFIYISDLIECIAKYSDDKVDRTKDIFNLAGNELVSLRQIAENTGRIFSKDLSFSDKHMSPSIRNPISEKIKKQFGWSPKIDLNEGLKLCANRLT